MTLTNSSRRTFEGGVRHLCAAALGLLFLFAATHPAYGAGGTFFDGLDYFDTARWHKADGWTNGNPFNVGWRADHVTFSGGFMSLRLDTTPVECVGVRVREVSEDDGGSRESDNLR